MDRAAYLALAAALLLAGCKDMPQAHSESDIEDIAQDVAAEVVAPKQAELDTQISELQTEVDSLEASLGSLRTYTKAVHDALNEERESRERAVQEFADHYNKHTHGR